MKDIVYFSTSNFCVKKTVVIDLKKLFIKALKQGCVVQPGHPENYVSQVDKVYYQFQLKTSKSSVIYTMLFPHYDSSVYDLMNSQLVQIWVFVAFQVHFPSSRKSLEEIKQFP